MPTDVMPYALIATASHLIAGMADGQILCSDDQGDSWTDTAVRLSPLVAMAAA
jgi:hypothetical protein